MKFRAGEINVICTDLKRSLAFYRDVLGFVLVEKEGIARRLKYGNTHILLLPAANSLSPREPYCTAPTFSLDLIVDDIEEAFKYLRKNRVEFETDWEPGSSRFFIRDPDGLVLEVIESKIKG
jgi:catechol 2,3-dioxygenase-like lactoylglutathione lyase family enzyme